MTLLAINWGNVGVQTLYFIMAFSILVVLHELGHFLPARWFKCRVEKFYLFFNPWFSLAKKKIGETEWGLGWVPFGGYVKISGMVDESMDKEQLKLPPQPYEFRAKPAWQRLIIMLGGVIVNIILAIVIFIFILWVWGEEYLPPQNAKYGVVAERLGKAMGVQDGDIITKVNGVPVRDEDRVGPMIILNNGKNVTVLRNGQEHQLAVPDTMVKALNSAKGQQFASVGIPTVVKKLAPGSNAEKAGLQPNDTIIGVDSVNTGFFQLFQRELATKKEKTVTLNVIRKNDTLKVPVNVTKNGTIGFERQSPKDLGFEMETQKFTFLEAIPAGWNKCWTTLGNYVTGLKHLFTGQAKASESLGSVFSIGSIFPTEWGQWQQFWTLTAIFSIILAFMNVLPIPALDGGHALFTIVEMVSGRKPSDKFMEYAQMVGMVLLLGLMAYALGLDFLRIFRNL
ncbi:MAG: rseP [Chitinophagaceae bacterium]|jgi:regulator of sigma E protease|nr:rseP [Chitinophagaceae bacterium]